MNKKIKNIIASYLKELQEMVRAAEYGHLHTDELSFRAPIDPFLRLLVKTLHNNDDIVVVHEPKKQNTAGHPDWLLYNKNTMAVYCYIEAKGVSKNTINLKQHKQQFDRYKQLGHRLIITDGLEFLFYTPDRRESYGHVCLIDKKRFTSSRWDVGEQADKFLVFIREFLSDPNALVCSEKQLMELVAIRTRNLANEINKVEQLDQSEASSNEELASIIFIREIREFIFGNSGKIDNSYAGVGDFVAQVIMFGLLYAHRTMCKSDSSAAERKNVLLSFTDRSFDDTQLLSPFRRVISRIVKDETDASQFIKIWIQECQNLLAHVRMRENHERNTDFHHLYEDFLRHYSPEIQVDYGAFYTPKNLASFLVALSKAVCKHDFGRNRSFYSRGSLILDPCCGTGSFLEEIITQAGRAKSYSVTGIEILPAPYMLANYRLNKVFNEFSKAHVSVDIILANTLSDSAYNVIAKPTSVEDHEYVRFRQCLSSPIHLIIGNPPSTDANRRNTGANFKRIESLMEDFRPPKCQRKLRTNDQKQVLNPFMQFTRWVAEFIINSGNDALMTLVLPSDFLSTRSFLYARKFLCENFSSIWVVKFDDDSRKLSSCAENNLFKTKQGRAAIILSRRRTFKGTRDGIKTFKWLDISHFESRDKTCFLVQPIVNLDSLFSEHDIDFLSGQFKLVPTPSYNQSLYKLFWPVTSTTAHDAVFMHKCSGHKLSPTALFHCVDKGTLTRRTRQLAQSELSQEQIFDDYFRHQVKVANGNQLNAFRAEVLRLEWGSNTKRSDIESSIKTYDFRPFVSSNVIIHDALFAAQHRIKNAGMRERPELIKLFSNQSALGISIAPCPEHLAEHIDQFVSFCWNYPDNDKCRRGNGHVFSNQYFNYETGELHDNVNSFLLTKMSEVWGPVPSSVACNYVLFYTYAILCSSVYLSTFKGGFGGESPRIPFVRNAFIARRLRRLGKLLASLENFEITCRNRLGIDYSMLCTQIGCTSFRLSSVRYDKDKSIVSLVSDTNLTIDVPCTSAIYSTVIAGYNVISVWVKFHSYVYRRKCFDHHELKLFISLLNRLAHRLRLIEEIDKIVEKIIQMPLDEFITSYSSEV